MKLANLHIIRKGNLQRFIKNPYTHFFWRWSWIMNDLREHRCIYVDQGAHSLQKQMLILCVFSGSDVRSKWRLLYSLLHPTTKHLNRLIRDILSSPAPESTQWQTALSSLRAGLRQDGLVNQLSWEGPAQNYIILTGISEQPDLREDFKIKHWVDFYHYRMDVYTHFQHTFMFKQFVKWILHPMTPLRLVRNRPLLWLANVTA